MPGRYRTTTTLAVGHDGLVSRFGRVIQDTNVLMETTRSLSSQQLIQTGLQDHSYRLEVPFSSRKIAMFSRYSKDSAAILPCKEHKVHSFPSLLASLQPWPRVTPEPCIDLGTANSVYLARVKVGLRLTRLDARLESSTGTFSALYLSVYVQDQSTSRSREHQTTRSLSG